MGVSAAGAGDTKRDSLGIRAKSVALSLQKETSKRGDRGSELKPAFPVSQSWEFIGRERGEAVSSLDNGNGSFPKLFFLDIPGPSYLFIGHTCFFGLECILGCIFHV